MKKESVGRFLIADALYSCFCGLVHPITPTLFNNLNFPDYVYGLVFASMSLGMFLFGPFWGKLGDRIGHSKSFAIALPSYALSQMAFGMARTPMGAIISRFFSGFTGGGAVVSSLAYIINATDSENRSRIMVYRTAISSISNALGYFIGGVAGTVSIPMVFKIQGVFLFLGSLYTLIFIKDPDMYDSNYVSDKSLNPLNTFYNMKNFMTKSLMIFLITVFTATMASNNFDISFNYYINKDLKLNSSYNGIIKAITGIMGLVTNFTINLYIIKKTNIKKSIIYIFIFCGLFSLISPFMTTIRMFFTSSILFYLFNTMYLPLQQMIFISDFKNQSSGIMSGIFNSVSSMGMILGSLMQGFMYSVNSRLPFVMAAAIFISTACVYIYYCKYTSSMVSCDNFN